MKARGVLRGVQDRQKDDIVKDSPTDTRPGLRLLLQLTINRGWEINSCRVISSLMTKLVMCQLPKEMKLPWYMCARMLMPAYGLDDAPRKW